MISINASSNKTDSHPAPKATRLSMRNGVSPSLIGLPAGSWKTILDFLIERLPNVSPQEWCMRMTNGDILNAQGEAFSPDSPYQAGNKVYYYRHVPQEITIPFTETILYQDSFLVVADKPHFLPVTPAGRYLHETLLVRLKKKLNMESLVPIHRIDRETAGIVIFAIQPQTRALYQNMFKDKAVKKHYEAIAPWQPEHSFPMTVNSRLVEGKSFMKMTEIQGEANARTLLDLLEVKGHLARYALTPITGKKHQLRVHMASLGIPIINDQIYPYHYPETLDEKSVQLSYEKPLKLLSKSISFIDPVSGQPRQFESRLKLTF